MSLVLIQGFPRRPRELPRWFFMLDGPRGLRPLFVDGRIPGFASEDSARAWHRAAREGRG